MGLTGIYAVADRKESSFLKKRSKRLLRRRRGFFLEFKLRRVGCLQPTNPALQQPKCCQFPPHLRRHLRRTLHRRCHIRWRIFCIEITPSLKRLFQSALHRHQHLIESQLRARSPILFDRLNNIDNPLPRRHDAVDHPIDRSAFQNLLRPPRKMPCPMPRRRMSSLPAPYIVDALTTHGKFDEMQRQEKSPGK